MSKLNHFVGPDWRMIDPTCEACIEARHQVYNGFELTNEQRYMLGAMAAAYAHLVGHPAGANNAVQRLREIRRQAKR